MRKLILAGMEISGRACTVCGLQEEDGRFWELRVFPEHESTILGNIYVGQIETISNNLQAAFVRIAPEVRCFFPLKEARGLPLRPGDQVIVQVTREAMKGKLPSVSAHMTLTGRSLVIHTRDTQIGISKKLDEEKRTDVKENLVPLLQEQLKKMQTTSVGVIIRTNAAEEDPAVILKEADDLIHSLTRISTQGSHRTLYSCLYRPVSEVLGFVRDFYRKDTTCIITDAFEDQEKKISQKTKDVLASDPKRVQVVGGVARDVDGRVILLS